MNEQEARDFFDHLPLDDRLRLVREILGDIEGRISRARAELNGETPQLVLPELEGLPELAEEARLREAETGRDGRGSRDSGGAARTSADQADGEIVPPLDEYADFDMAELTGGQKHTINSLRLMDAAAHYEKLLKKYGYVRGVPDPKTILRREQESALAKGQGRRKPDSAWAEWVAKDSDTLDRPHPHEWSDWVALGDDDGEE